MKPLCLIGWLLVALLSVCLWQEWTHDWMVADEMQAQEAIDPHHLAHESTSYPVYINRDTPETTAALALCREKLKKMEMPE